MSSAHSEGRMGSVESWSAVDAEMRARDRFAESPANHGMSILRAKYGALSAPHQSGESAFKSTLPEEVDWKPFPAFPPALGRIHLNAISSSLALL